MFSTSPRPSSALMCAIFLGIAMALGSQPASAQGGLVKMGPIDPVIGYPMWYEDSNGLKLAPCTNPAFCFFGVPDPTLPVHFPTSPTDPAANWPDELFYWAGEALMFGSGGARGRLVQSLEGAFGTGPVLDGDQIVFARLRIRFSGLVPNASFKITYPYGVKTLESDATGDIFWTQDVGIGAAGDYAGVLNTKMFPFLLPAGYTGGAPGDFMDPAGIPIPVQGATYSVNGAPANYFQVDGPGADVAFDHNANGLDSARETLFTLQGMVANRFGAKAEKASYQKTATGVTSVDVWATSAPGQSLVASIDGGVSTPLKENAATGRYFLRAELGPLLTPPQFVTVSNILDQPPSTVTVPIPDEVLVSSAVFTIGSNLVVAANSSDLTGAQVLVADVDGLTPVPLPGAGRGDVAGPVNLPPASNPPEAVTVSSSGGGSQTFPVTVIGMGTTIGGAVSVIANAGADQSVLSGATVTLDGAGSLGMVASYAWTSDAASWITLSNASVANPTFTAPGGLPGGLLDITVTLTVFDALGLSTSDSALIHVSDPVAPAPDKVTITGARYEINKETWRVDGTADVLRNQTVDIYLGDSNGPFLLRKIGEAVVDAVGTWGFRPGNGSAANNGSIPIAGETNVWGISRLPGVMGTLVFRAK